MSVSELLFGNDSATIPNMTERARREVRPIPIWRSQINYSLIPSVLLRNPTRVWNESRSWQSRSFPQPWIFRPQWERIEGRSEGRWRWCSTRNYDESSRDNGPEDGLSITHALSPGRVNPHRTWYRQTPRTSSRRSEHRSESTLRFPERLRLANSMVGQTYEYRIGPSSDGIHLFNSKNGRSGEDCARLSVEGKVINSGRKGKTIENFFAILSLFVSRCCLLVELLFVSHAKKFLLEGKVNLL